MKLRLLHPFLSKWVACLLVMAVFLSVTASAKEDRPAEAGAPAGVKPGTTALLKCAEKGMRYFLRVPKKYDAKKGARLIVFLHGSSMNGLTYLRSFEAKKWCDENILCCPNGENGGDPFGQNNFGFTSAPLVAEVTKEVQGAFKTTVTYIGGHSQGAFLTYSVITHFPGLYHGAFPVAGDCWMQNEPHLWESKPDIAKKQRAIAIAVIHGRADPVVAFSQGEHAYDCFRAAGWTKLRLFAPEKLNHMFMLSPVEEALEWIDTVNGLNAKTGSSLAAKWAREGEWGWVWHAAKGAGTRAAAMQKAAEDAASEALPVITKTLNGKPEEWMPAWTEFRRIHGETNAAKTLVADGLSKRDSQRENAMRLFNEAQSLFRSQKKEEAYQVLERLLAEAPWTYHAFFASKWLADRK